MLNTNVLAFRTFTQENASAKKAMRECSASKKLGEGGGYASPLPNSLCRWCAVEITIIAHRRLQKGHNPMLYNEQCLGQEAPNRHFTTRRCRPRPARRVFHNHVPSSNTTTITLFIPASTDGDVRAARYPPTLPREPPRDVTILYGTGDRHALFNKYYRPALVRRTDHLDLYSYSLRDLGGTSAALLSPQTL